MNIHLWRLVGAVAFALMTFSIVDKISIVAEPQVKGAPGARARERASSQRFETVQLALQADSARADRP